MKVRDADVKDILRLIGEASGFNVVVGPGVSGKITLSLEEVPWDQVLDVVLSTLKLGAERNRNVLRVLTLANLTQEKQQELNAKRALEESAPKITRVFPISYADLGELQKILAIFGKGVGKTGESDPTLQGDTRTNSLIVQDIPENIERIGKLIKLLDTQTPQVLVEAKIVEATEAFSRRISGSVGFGNSPTFQHQVMGSFNGGTPINTLLSDPTGNPQGALFDSPGFAATSTGGGSLGASLNLGLFVPGFERLNAILTLGENESLVKIVSSPKTVVLNKQAASILQSIPVLFERTVINGATSTTEVTQVDANISLGVTPTVTNDESVLMDLKISRDVPQNLGTATAIGRRNMNTKVLVESGATLVIGGVYSVDETESETGFPLLRDIPILGFLFGSSSDSTTRSELFIFITPKILNVQRAGLVG